MEYLSRLSYVCIYIYIEARVAPNKWWVWEKTSDDQVNLKFARLCVPINDA